MSSPGDRFPPTRRSAVGGIASDDAAVRARAFDVLVRAYWKPVYKHVRVRWRRETEDARDLTQGFFARAFEKKHLGGYDPARARFRTYLRGSLDNFVLEASRDAARQKRGGGAPLLSLDFDGAEEELEGSGALRDPSTIESCFDREWTRSLYASAVAALEASCVTQGKRVYFEAFRRYVIDPEMSSGADAAAGPSRPSYAELAEALDLSVTDVTNYLAWARRELRTCVLEQLREITATDEEYREEAQALGVTP